MRKVTQVRADILDAQVQAVDVHDQVLQGAVVQAVVRDIEVNPIQRGVYIHLF